MGHILGTPCIAPLVDKDLFNFEIKKDKNLTALKKEIKKYNKVFLYAPTFRDSGSNFLKNLKFEIKKLNDICQKKSILFLIKMHPWCNLNLKGKHSNIIILDKTYDATICIGLSDIIISDYSSMFHNALAGNKKTILMHGDIDEYRNNNRDIYDWALDDLQGHIINDFNDLYDIIKNKTKIKPIPQKIIDKYWDNTILKEPFKFLRIFK